MPNRVNYRDVLKQIFLIWLICYGAITLQTLAGLFLPCVMLPYVGFALILVIIYFGNHNVSSSNLNCSLMTHYTVYILTITGVVMLVANLFNTNFITNKYSEFSHQDYPYHVSFIIYPVTAFYYGIALLRRGKTEYCKACKTVAGFSVKEMLRRNVLHHECKFQIRLGFWMAVAITLVTYGYYFYFYRSNKIGRLYTPDKFFMYILPVAGYMLSVVYLFFKYAGMQFEISLNENVDEGKLSSRVRYMIVWQDKMLLRETVISEFGTGFWDTPADKVISFNEALADIAAENIFREISGAKDFTLRKLFITNTKSQNVLHYAVFMPDEDCEVPRLSGKWLTLRDIDEMLHMGIITRAFAMELHRIHTITMAWKTYDREGNRLYPIKNYQPTFRLRDFKNWDVDYDDLHWLGVSANNEDKPFFHIKRLWRKYISGIDNRWKRSKS